MNSVLIGLVAAALLTKSVWVLLHLRKVSKEVKNWQEHQSPAHTEEGEERTPEDSVLMLGTSLS